ncbi:hypothetical protein ACQJBY_065484 [Aegilops geniculata]
MNSNPSTIAPANTQYSNGGHVVFWIGTSNLAVGSTMQGILINCAPSLIVLFIRKYSLRSELLVLEMEVSRTKIRLDTSISMTSNSKRRE